MQQALGNDTTIAMPKGQLISKGLFGILNSSKKRTKKFELTTMHSTRLGKKNSKNDFLI